MTQCYCPVCKGRATNEAGFHVADLEVIPFFKRELLKLKYPNHPFSRKYGGLAHSLLCYSQALAYDRAHSIKINSYYTENKWLLKFSSELFKKFGLNPIHKSELKNDVKLVCEFNVEP